MNTVATRPRDRRRAKEIARPALVYSAWTLVATRLGYLVCAFGVNWVIATLKTDLRPGFFDVWLKWDAIVYLLIAQHGYSSPLTEPHATAFFPLLPLMLRLLLAAGFAGVVAELLIAAFGCLVAFWYLYRLAEEELGNGSGRRAVLYLALFPSAVFLVPGYTEPLFLAGAIAAFYYARRGAWGAVGLPAAVAVASRFEGVFLLTGVVAEFGVQFLRRGTRARPPVGAAILSFVAALVPLAGYCAFLYRVRGDPFYFVVDERLGWDRRFVGPLQTLINSSHHGGFALELSAAVIGLVFTGWLLVRREWGYAVFVGATMSALLTSGYYLSIPRLLVTFFPIMLLLADWTAASPRRHIAVLSAMIPLALTATFAYTHGWGFY